MTFIPRKTKGISVPDVFCTICLHTWSHSELNNCNYCNCLSCRVCSRYPDVALYPSALTPDVLSLVSIESLQQAAPRSLQQTVFVGDINTVQPGQASNLSRIVIMAPCPAPCLLCIYQHTLKILSDSDSQRSKNRIRNKTGHDLPDAGSWETDIMIRYLYLILCICYCWEKFNL